MKLRHLPAFVQLSACGNGAWTQRLIYGRLQLFTYVARLNHGVIVTSDVGERYDRP